MNWRFDVVSDITVVIGFIIVTIIMCKVWNWYVMKQYMKQRDNRLSFTQVFYEDDLEKIEIVGIGNDGNSDYDVSEAIRKIELPSDARIKV